MFSLTLSYQLDDSRNRTIGRFGSFNPLRARRIGRTTADTAPLLVQSRVGAILFQMHETFAFFSPFVSTNSSPLWYHFCDIFCDGWRILVCFDFYFCVVFNLSRLACFFCVNRTIFNFCSWVLHPFFTTKFCPFYFEFLKRRVFTTAVWTKLLLFSSIKSMTLSGNLRGNGCWW